MTEVKCVMDFVGILPCLECWFTQPDLPGAARWRPDPDCDAADADFDSDVVTQTIHGTGIHHLHLFTNIDSLCMIHPCKSLFHTWMVWFR